MERLDPAPLAPLARIAPTARLLEGEATKRPPTRTATDGRADRLVLIGLQSPRRHGEHRASDPYLQFDGRLSVHVHRRPAFAANGPHCHRRGWDGREQLQDPVDGLGGWPGRPCDGADRSRPAGSLHAAPGSLAYVGRLKYPPSESEIPETALWNAVHSPGLRFAPPGGRRGL